MIFVHACICLATFNISEQMGDFVPVFPLDFQSVLFVTFSAIAFVALVTFFLYENKQKRNLLFELVFGAFLAITLGCALFFGLLKLDIVL